MNSGHDFEWWRLYFDLFLLDKADNRWMVLVAGLIVPSGIPWDAFHYPNNDNYRGGYCG